MTYLYRVLPTRPETVETPVFDVITDGVGVLDLEQVGPVIHPFTGGNFQFICRVKDSVSGRVYAPWYGARLSAKAYVTTEPIRMGTKAGKGHNYRHPLTDREKANATAVACYIAYKPATDVALKKGIYIGLNIEDFVWTQTTYIYIEFEWISGTRIPHNDSRANYGIHPIEPNCVSFYDRELQVRREILGELNHYWLDR